MVNFVNQLGQTKLRPSSASSLYDALNIAYLCENSTDAAIAVEALAPLSQSLFFARSKHTEARERLAQSIASNALMTFYVSPNGSDTTGDGSLGSPFASLPRAAEAARAIPNRKPGSVLVVARGGTYYMGGKSGGGALFLTSQDSNVSYAAYPGEIPILSGAMEFPPGSLTWSPAPSAPLSGTMQAIVPGVPQDQRALAWEKAHSGTPYSASRAGPPPLVSSLFLNGRRQVRARYPNGNPQDSSGICFSATQRPGEGCSGWSSCAVGSTGSQPAPGGVSVGYGPKRGSSPTFGCPQCHNSDSFHYTIYPPPADHPVYTSPLPGIGWGNTSVFSFWGSPFDRPSGVAIHSDCPENDFHWRSLNYSNPTNAVVHMFHSGLWGGWAFAVDNVTTTTTTNNNNNKNNNNDPSLSPVYQDFPVLSEPTRDGLALWLRADTLAAAGAKDGVRLSSWADTSSGKGLVAEQSAPQKQPIYVSSGTVGGAPAVRFLGAQVLGSEKGDFGSSTTQIAVVRDGGTTTDYCSGIFNVQGSMNSICTKRAEEPSGAPADDDPRPPGTPILATALDWNGSPADPGHRDLTGKSSVLSALYTPDSSFSFVGGCLELSVSNPGSSGKGFFVGSRNDEMGRYFKGDLVELLVYNRALNTTEHLAAVAYLNTKYGLESPKHCAPPPNPPSDVRINFGYGGFQEARGSGISGGQHFYIENVFEELDSPFVPTHTMKPPPSRSPIFPHQTL